MNFSIISPTSKRTMIVTWLELESMRGNLVIQPGYAPSIIMLKPNSTIKVGFSNNTTESFNMLSGILQVTRDYAQLILDI